MVSGKKEPGLGSLHMRRWLLLALGITALFCERVHAQGKEYQLKAAFLFNFAQFVDWPSTAYASDKATFRIGVLGDNPFGTSLSHTISGESIKAHKMEVVTGGSLEELKGCQMIFISKSERGQIDDILGKLDSGPVLTVSEMDGFAQKGGMINFFLDGSKVRFEVNPDAAKKCGLKISSQVLSLGKLVKTAKSNK